MPFKKPPNYSITLEAEAGKVKVKVHLHNYFLRNTAIKDTFCRFNLLYYTCTKQGSAMIMTEVFPTWFSASVGLRTFYSGNTQTMNKTDKVTTPPLHASL